jgi:hypothetical protein
LYKIKPDQIPLDNIEYHKLLKNIHVSLDDNLFDIHELIPALIPNYKIIEIPFDNHYRLDEVQLISNLKDCSIDEQKLYTLINHSEFDKDIIKVFQESAKHESYKDGLEFRNI